VAALARCPRGRTWRCTPSADRDPTPRLAGAGRLAGANGALQALGTDVEIAAALSGVDLVHSHTWYANGAGLLAGLVHDVPHVVTAHSLEPRRPWRPTSSAAATGCRPG
jgi:starch synthase